MQGRTQEVVVRGGEEMALGRLWEGKDVGSSFLRVRLIEPDASIILRGVFLTRKREEAYVRIEICHEAPRTKSRVVLRGIADDQSTVAVHEVAKILRGASGSETHVEAKAILYSDQARAELEPYLELDEHEVRATHSAWVGPIEDEERFYLMSRGFSKKAAETILLRAFFHPVREVLPKGYAAI